MDWEGVETRRTADGVEFTLHKNQQELKGAYDEVARLIVRFDRDPETNHPIVTAVSLDASRSRTPLTASVLKRFPWERWLRSAETIYTTPQPDLFYSGGDWREQRANYLDTWAEYHDKVQAAVGHPGARGREPAHYRRVAALYQALLTDGETKPIKRLADDLGISIHTISGWVKKARSLGYLPKGHKGKAG
jgi:hypothetical protein